MANANEESSRARNPNDNSTYIIEIPFTMSIQNDRRKYFNINHRKLLCVHRSCYIKHFEISLKI